MSEWTRDLDADEAACKFTIDMEGCGFQSALVSLQYIARVRELDAEVKRLTAELADAAVIDGLEWDEMEWMGTSDDGRDMYSPKQAGSENE